MSALVNYKNTKIHYTESGKGTTVVLLHGFLENTTMFRSLELRLSAKFRVVCVDLLGHGQSENLGYVHTMREMADAVKKVLEHLCIRRSFFVGHSMGGYVALAFADVYPNYIKGLVLLNSTAKADSKEKQLHRNRAIEVVKKDHSSFIRTSIPMLFSSACKNTHSEAILEIKKEALKTSKQGVIAALEGMKIRENNEEMLRLAAYPSLFVLGKKDPVLRYKDLLDQANYVKSEIKTLENGHMSLLEDKEEAEQVILEFIKKH